MEIRTERLVLKPISSDGLDALAELLTDDVVKQFYSKRKIKPQF